MFVGGGTPGLLSERELINLGELISSHRLAEGCEWSIELAPSEINTRKLEVLRDMGVNRISLGVQTFDDRLMTELGRDHSPDKAREAFENIRSLGFDSVNLDLIFGIPGQSLEEWKADLHEAVNLEPEHISTYCLTFEEDTALYYRLSRGVSSKSIRSEMPNFMRLRGIFFLLVDLLSTRFLILLVRVENAYTI